MRAVRLSVVLKQIVMIQSAMWEIRAMKLAGELRRRRQVVSTLIRAVVHMAALPTPQGFVKIAEAVGVVNACLTHIALI
jgi:hypothetical protein